MNEQLKQALDALRQAAASAGAPEHMEGNLRLAFRAQHKKRSSLYGWLTGAIAASLLMAAALSVWEPTAAISPPAPVIASMPRPPSTPQVAAARPKARRVPRRSGVQKEREVATEFFPIPYAPALTPVDRGQLIRVRMPASSMRNFGLPVNEERMFERVRADVLLGEDGIARAIRFVR